MDGTKDDIEYAKRRIDELMKIRASRPWSKVMLKDEVLNFVGVLPSDINVSWGNALRSKMKGLHVVIEQAAYRLVYFSPQMPLDSEAKDILDTLLREDKINKAEWGRAIWQRILRRADDGVLESAGPRPLAFIVGKAGIATLILIGSAGITKMVTEPFNLFYVLPLAIYGGLLMGIFGGLLYQFAWGHHDLAKRIKYYSPHHFIRLNISELKKR
jgi:hypothetical protein